MWVFSIYNLINGIFVARGVGEEALAAINISMPYFSFIFALGMMFATGISTVVSISMGQGNKEKANNYFNQNIFVLTVVSLMLMMFTLCNLNSVAKFLGASETTLQYTKEYIGITSCFAIFIIISYNLEVLVRANGVPHISTIGVAFCAIMNILLDYLFIFRFNWGIKGAALATGLGQAASTLFFTIYFIVHKTKLNFRKFHFELSIYKRIIPIGIADGITELSNGVVIFLFNHAIISLIGEKGIISYTVISYIYTLVLMTMTGITQGIQPLISFYYGKRNFKYCHKLLRYGITVVVIISVLIFTIVQIGTHFIVSLFIDENSHSVFDYTTMSLRIYSIAFLLTGFNVIMAGFFASIEHPYYSFTISLGRGLVLIWLSLLVLSALLGEYGIWLSPSISEGLSLIITCFFINKYCKHRTLPIQNQKKVFSRL